MSLANPRRRVPATQAGDNGEPLLKTASTLRKGATFNSPKPRSIADSLFTPPTLPRAQSHMDDVIDANRRRAALTLNELEEVFALTENLSISSKPEAEKPLRDTSLPIPRGFLDMPQDTAKETQRRVLRPRSARRSNHASDSGLGSSLVSSGGKSVGDATAKKTQSQGTAVTITRSASATMEGLPALGPKAVNRIQEHTLGPLLERTELKDFEPIVLDIPRRIRSKQIICLRDVEKTLLFMAPVSQLFNNNGVWESTYRKLLVKEKAKSAVMYLDFCFTSIRCIQATVEYLSDREQVRPGDRPYTNGYFIDLKEQIYQYGRDLAAAKGGELADNMDLDQYVPRLVPLQASANPSQRSDEIKLFGGISENGRPAELVRVRKDGTAISMLTGKPVDMHEGPAQVKRSLSEVREDEEEIMRSMARRKKNASPEELAPKKCREPGCNKEFKRPCDLTKHEKTHSRPWKCPIPTCKYHEFGWPTEKEMDRHINDKHSDAPAMYECQFKPCPYKSKRESNCKQHMEKAHGWTYVRTKTNGGKKLPMQSGSSVQQTPPLGNVSTPSEVYSVPTPEQEQAPQVMTSDFPLYPADADWLATYGLQPETLDGMDISLEHLSPSSAASYEQYPPYQNGSQFITDEDIYAATARIPTQSLPLPNDALLYNKMMPLAPLPLQQPRQAHIHHHHQLPSQQPQHAQQQQMQAFNAPQHFGAAPQAPAPHFSPNGQHNAMLYTPPSLDEVDDTFDEPYGAEGDDFQLFPAHMGKGNSQSLFGGMPSADLGFSQTTQPEIFQQVDLSQLDYHNFHE
jgi:hypothetical protein